MGHVACKTCIAASAAVLLPALAMAADAPSASAGVVALVEQVCLPLIGKQALEAVSSASGLARRDGDWTLKMEGKASARVTPPGGANPTVCMASLEYDKANGPPMRSALANWAGSKKLATLKDNVASKSGDLQYHTWSWSGPMAGKTTTVVFTERAELDGRPTYGDLYEATLLVNTSG